MNEWAKPRKGKSFSKLFTHKRGFPASSLISLDPVLLLLLLGIVCLGSPPPPSFPFPNFRRGIRLQQLKKRALSFYSATARAVFCPLSPPAHFLSIHFTHACERRRQIASISPLFSPPKWAEKTITTRGHFFWVSLYT